MPRSSRATARAARWAANGLLSLTVAACLLLAVGPALLGYRTLTVLSGSMRPLISVGSLVVITREPQSELAPGQIITISAPVPGHPVVTHRVVEVVHLDDGHLAVRTRGDRNATPDPWLARLPGTTVWRYRATVPYVGRALHVLTGRPARLAAGVLLPAALATWVLSGVWLRSPTRPRAPERARHRRSRQDGSGQPEPVPAAVGPVATAPVVIELPPDPSPPPGPAEAARRAFAARAHATAALPTKDGGSRAHASPGSAAAAPRALPVPIPMPRPPAEPSPLQRLRVGQGHAPA